jgi:ankyrin repeat protein
MKRNYAKARWMVIAVVLTAVLASTLPRFMPRIRVEVQRTYLPVNDDNSLYLAISTGEPVENVRAILEKRPELLQTYRFNGRPPLVLAAEWKRSDLVLLFLQMGADVNSRSERDSGAKDTTALHVAADLDDVKTIEILLRYKADTKLVERSGRTAYQVAVDAGSNAAADVLRQQK